jgi:hypothetical protein
MSVSTPGLSVRSHEILWQKELGSRLVAELPAPVILRCHATFFATVIENYANKNSYKKFTLMQKIDVKVRSQWDKWG